jgi:uncharacterized protein YndB with AHSA1/START domain
MPTDKDFKRLVRGRMRQTGEAYTTARTNLLKKRAPSSAPPAAPAPRSAPADFARVAGMSDDVVKARTGCGWERWVRSLDRVNAHQWPHRAIAEYLRETYDTPPWWTQMVTVGYERIKGLRERGQRRSGDYEATRSRTIDAAVSRVFRAFTHRPTRTRWLPEVELVIRRATPNRSVRITWPDGSSVEALFATKGRSRSQVQIQHGKLPSREAADRMKAFWSERLDALVELLDRTPARAGVGRA